MDRENSQSPSQSEFLQDTVMERACLRIKVSVRLTLRMR